MLNRRADAGGQALRKVVLLALPGLSPFEFGAVCEVFGVDRTSAGGPAFQFEIATADPGPVMTTLGMEIVIAQGLDVAADADLIAVPAYEAEQVDERFLAVIRDAEQRGAWVLSVCSGTSALAQAGVLDGRRSTTHWTHAKQLARDYPKTSVSPNVLFVDDRRVVTSAGLVAGVDAALHIVREVHGVASANIIARGMITPPHRNADQKQISEAPLRLDRADSIDSIARWMLDHMHEAMTVAELAGRARMSPGRFARRFREEFGLPPTAWLNRQRVMQARRLLEQTTHSVEVIAAHVGHGSAASMRRHFRNILGLTPAAYRSCSVQLEASSSPSAALTGQVVNFQSFASLGLQHRLIKRPEQTGRVQRRIE